MPKPDAMTPQRLAVLKFIAAYLVENRQSPSLRDVSHFTRTGEGTASYHLGRLERDGLIERMHRNGCIRLKLSEAGKAALR